MPGFVKTLAGELKLNFNAVILVIGIFTTTLLYYTVNIIFPIKGITTDIRRVCYVK